jgi:hypothetical protein
MVICSRINSTIKGARRIHKRPREERISLKSSTKDTTKAIKKIAGITQNRFRFLEGMIWSLSWSMVLMAFPMIYIPGIYPTGVIKISLWLGLELPISTILFLSSL